MFGFPKLFLMIILLLPAYLEKMRKECKIIHTETEMRKIRFCAQLIKLQIKAWTQTFWFQGECCPLFSGLSLWTFCK